MIQVNDKTYEGVSLPFTVQFNLKIDTFATPYQVFLNALSEGVHRPQRYRFLKKDNRYIRKQGVFTEVTLNDGSVVTGVIWDYTPRLGLQLITRREAIILQQIDDFSFNPRAYTEVKEVNFKKVVDLTLKNNYSLSYI